MKHEHDREELKRSFMEASHQRWMAPLTRDEITARVQILSDRAATAHDTARKALVERMRAHAAASIHTFVDLHPEIEAMAVEVFDYEDHPRADLALSFGEQDALVSLQVTDLEFVAPFLSENTVDRGPEINVTKALDWLRDCVRGFDPYSPINFTKGTTS